MVVRRTAIIAALALLAVPARAQAGFVGTWQGDVPGIGAARLFITAVRANGQIEGRMEFDLQSFASTFGDKPDSSKNINHGVVSGPALAIESALGGSYELALDGDRLSGVYTRGTTYKVAVTFTRS